MVETDIEDMSVDEVFDKKPSWVPVKVWAVFILLIAIGLAITLFAIGWLIIPLYIFWRGWKYFVPTDEEVEAKAAREQ